MPFILIKFIFCTSSSFQYLYKSDVTNEIGGVTYIFKSIIHHYTVTLLHGYMVTWLHGYMVTRLHLIKLGPQTYTILHIDYMAVLC